MGFDPSRPKRRKQPFLDSFVYALRNQIERFFNKLKNARRLAIRYDKTAKSYLGFIHIVSARLCLKQFINRTDLKTLVLRPKITLG